MSFSPFLDLLDDGPRPGDPTLPQQMVWQGLDNLREQQASSLSYFDCFWGFAVLAIVLLFLVPLMKRSVAEKGAHVAAE